MSFHNHPLAPKWLPILAVLFFSLIITTQAMAQLKVIKEEPAEQVHWALGAFFGTGWYQVEENRSASESAPAHILQRENVNFVNYQFIQENSCGRLATGCCCLFTS